MTLWLFSTGQPWLAFSDIAIMRFLNCFTGPGSIWQTLQNILNLSKRFSLCGHSHHVWHIKQTHVLKCLEDHFMGSMWIEMDQPDSGNLGSDWCPLSSTVVHCRPLSTLRLPPPRQHSTWPPWICEALVQCLCLPNAHTESSRSRTATRYLLEDEEWRRIQ